jgi:hypothetical protein
VIDAAAMNRRGSFVRKARNTSWAVGCIFGYGNQCAKLMVERAVWEASGTFHPPHNCEGKNKFKLCHPDRDFLTRHSPTATCAAFSEESRMKLATPPSSTGNPGERSRGICSSPNPERRLVVSKRRGHPSGWPLALTPQTARCLHFSNLRHDTVEDCYMFPGGESAYAGLRHQYGCAG